MFATVWPHRLSCPCRPTILEQSNHDKKKANWLLRIHTLTGARVTPPASVVATFSTFSRYTPASAEEKHAIVTAASPSKRDCTGWDVAFGLFNSSWSRTTMATPADNTTKQSHCLTLYARPSIMTETIAVVTSFAWDVTWKRGAERFERATYVRVFCMKYRRAGMLIFKASNGRSKIFSLNDVNKSPLVTMYSKAHEIKNCRVN